MSTRAKKRAKFTNSARITLSALSLLGFVGGWNLIGQLEKEDEALASEPVAPPTPVQASVTTNFVPKFPEWPTISPMTEIAPVPTLIPTRTTLGQIDASFTQDSTLNVEPVLDQIPVAAPVPTLAPLPALAPLPELPSAPLPPPPPPPPVQQQSSGS